MSEIVIIYSCEHIQSSSVSEKKRSIIARLFYIVSEKLLERAKFSSDSVNSVWSVRASLIMSRIAEVPSPPASLFEMQ